MSEFSDQFAAAGAPVLLTMHGTTVTYTPPDGGDAVELVAMTGNWDYDVDQDNRGQKLIEALSVTMPRTEEAADGGNYVADPSPRGTVTIGGTEYQIADGADAIDQNDQFSVCKLILKKRTERTRPAYRGSDR